MDIFKQEVNPILDIGGKIREDNSIDAYHFTEFQPTNNRNLDAGGEIKFHVPSGDAYTLPSDTYLVLRGQFLRGDNAIIADTVVVAPVNNWPAYFFTEAHYSINNINVESITTFPTANLMYRTCIGTIDQDETGFDSGWAMDKTTDVTKLTTDLSNGVVPNGTNSGFDKRKQLFTRYTNAADERGRFSVRIPLRDMFGFHRDYNKVIYGASQELRFSRTPIDQAVVNMLQFAANPVGTINPKVVLEEASWWVPYVRPSVEVASKLYSLIESKASYPIAARTMVVNNFNLPTGRSFTWNPITLSVGSEQPLYAIIGFQNSDRLGADAATRYLKTASIFDFLDVRDLAIYANGESIPQSRRSYKGDRAQYEQMYQEFQDFKIVYDGTCPSSRSAVDYFDFKLISPLHIIDLSHMPKAMRTGTVQLQIRAEFESEIPVGSIATLVLISRKVITMQSDGSRFNVIVR